MTTRAKVAAVCFGALAIATPVMGVPTQSASAQYLVSSAGNIGSGGSVGPRESALSPTTPASPGAGSSTSRPSTPRPSAAPRSVLDLPGVNAQGRRNPTLWSYPRRSIWNTPLGDRARLVPLGITPPTEQTLASEEDIIIAKPNARKRPVFYSPVGWNRGQSRCGARTPRVLLPSVPVSRSFFTDPGFHGITPNQSAAIVTANGGLIETQPFHACPDGTLVSKVAPPAWRRSSITRGGVPGRIGGGSHGGSGMTAFGGTIRKNEWVRKGRIPHAVKIELSAAKYLSRAGGGYRWPALHADRYALGHYAGRSGAARMGSLLALPQSFKVRRLKSPAAKILARALKGYGAYVVDDTRRDAVAFATEWGPAGRVTDQFEKEWGFPLSGDLSRARGAQAAFLGDMVAIYRRLAVVDDNSPRNVGGAGERVAPWAPKLARWPR